MNDTVGVYVPEYGSTMYVDRFVVLTDSQALDDATAVFINFTLDDLNAIKALRIGEDTMSSWLTVEPCALTDQSGLLVQPLEGGVNALNVRFHSEDTTHPELLEFDLNLNSGLLTLRFSETVTGPLLDITQVTFHSSMDSGLDPYLMHTLGLDMYTPGSPSGLSPEINATIRILDLNEIKRD